MRTIIITDSNVAKLYGQKKMIIFPAGEEHKTRATKEMIENRILEKGFSRDTQVVGLGGGVVCDMAGFVAATFCRGVPLILVPTTLLAMVDAAIGGKNGVNTEQGKNMIGTVYHPQRVITDLRFLKTLPEKEMRNGLVELLKHGVIADKELLESLDIAAAIEVKRRILAQDPSESGLRRILNLGHTIGHAIETLSDYQISHGEAVRIGIVIEAQLSYEMGVLEERSFEQICKIFGEINLPFPAEKIVPVLSLDKKSKDGVPRFVMLEKIGKPHPFGGEYCTSVDEKLLKRVLDDAFMRSTSAV